MNEPTNKEIEKVADDFIKCDACAWIVARRANHASFMSKITPEECNSLRQAEVNGWNILPGTPYIEEHGVFKGKSYVSRYIKEIHQINLKYGLYSYAQPKKGPLKSRGTNMTPKKKKRK